MICKGNEKLLNQLFNVGGKRIILQEDSSYNVFSIKGYSFGELCCPLVFMHEKRLIELL